MSKIAEVIYRFPRKDNRLRVAHSTSSSNSSLKQKILRMLKDLNLFSSLCVAQFIVWRTLRRERKEREIRRKRLTLVHKAGADWKEVTNT